MTAVSLASVPEDLLGRAFEDPPARVVRAIVVLNMPSCRLVDSSQSQSPESSRRLGHVERDLVVFRKAMLGENCCLRRKGENSSVRRRIVEHSAETSLQWEVIRGQETSGIRAFACRC